MKHPGPHIRRAIFSLLTPLSIPVYGNGDNNHELVYVEIGEFSTAGAGNKHQFGHSGTQVLEVISEQARGARKTVDVAGESVMTLMKPTVRDNELLSDVDFQVFVRGEPSINYLTEESQEGKKIVRLILRYNLLINEKR